MSTTCANTTLGNQQRWVGMREWLTQPHRTNLRMTCL